MYQGSMAAIVTPFVGDQLDEEGLRRNIRFLIENGTSGIVACATTGESPTLSEHEYESVIRIAVQECRDKIPVIAGAGTNSTAKTVQVMERAQRAGAQGLLIVTPYYNKPTQEGLYQHFSVLDRATDLPIIVYNVPGRTGVNILPRTVARIAGECRHVTAIKEASGNLDQVSELTTLLGPTFDILSGDDSLTLPMLALGATGVISVAANVVPRAVADVCSLFHENKVKEAAQTHRRLFPLVKALFLETNPIPVKKAMEMVGLAAGKPRPPLTELSADNCAVLKKALVEFGIEL